LSSNPLPNSQGVSLTYGESRDIHTTECDPPTPTLLPSSACCCYEDKPNIMSL